MPHEVDNAIIVSRENWLSDLFTHFSTRLWVDPLSMQFSACDPLYQVHVHRLSPRNNQPNPQLTSPRRWDCTYPAYSSCSACMQTFIFNLGNFGSTSPTFGPSARNKHKSIMLGMRIAPDGICKHSCLLFWRLAIWIFVLAGAMIIGDGASGRSRREKSIFKSTQIRVELKILRNEHDYDLREAPLNKLTFIV